MSLAFHNYAIYRLRAFSRLISAFHEQRIPVLHFTELDTDNSDLDVSLRLRRTFRERKDDTLSGPGEPQMRMAVIAWLAVSVSRMHQVKLQRSIGAVYIYRSTERSSSHCKAVERPMQS